MKKLFLLFTLVTISTPSWSKFTKTSESSDPKFNQNAELENNTPPGSDTQSDSASEGSDIPQVTEPPQLRSLNESWYTLWGLGFSSNSYDPSTQETVTSSTTGMIRSVQLSIDMLGFYWPINDHHTMHGIIVAGQSDNYRHILTNNIFSINSYLYAYSIQHFYGTNIGDGWFLRGEIGLAKMIITSSNNGTTYSGITDSGTGIDLGGGYAWPTSKETRFLLTGYYAYKSINSGKQNSVALSAGLLF